MKAALGTKALAHRAGPAPQKQRGRVICDGMDTWLSRQEQSVENGSIAVILKEGEPTGNSHRRKSLRNSDHSNAKIVSPLVAKSEFFKDRRLRHAALSLTSPRARTDNTFSPARRRPHDGAADDWFKLLGRL